MKSVLLGMSGGVDSSVSAIILKEAGYNVIGVTMELIPNDGKALNDAKIVCDKLEIKHYVLDLKDLFKEKVINTFIEEYKNCNTPNPCIYCNKYLKFRAMYEFAKSLGVDYIATGHYARVEYSKEYGKNVIKKSDAGKKDQTYVLCNIDRDVVDHIVFPLSDFKSKDEIRQIAKEYNLEVANKPDSEDICFIPDNDYIKFLEKNNIQGMKHGKIVDTKGTVLGKHQGLHRYTIGQRRGMGISSSTPLYVISLNKKKNELVIGTQDELYTDTVLVKDANCILFDNFKNGMKTKAKVRYLAPEKEATIYINDDNTLTVKFDEKIRAITPGQAIAFYIDDILLGGGIIA